VEGQSTGKKTEIKTWGRSDVSEVWAMSSWRGEMRVKHKTVRKVLSRKLTPSERGEKLVRWIHW